MLTDTLLESLRDMKEKYDQKAKDAETETLRHRFEGMRDAYENAIEIIRASNKDFDSI